MTTEIERARATGLVSYDPSGELRVRSGPGTVKWGTLSAFDEPVAMVSSGSCVTVDTVTHEGLLAEQGPPLEFYVGLGVAPPDIIVDAIEIYAQVQHSALGPHVITGPIGVEGAMPGDILCVEIIDAAPRVPYGINSIRIGKGALPYEFPFNHSTLLPFDMKRNIALFGNNIEIPLKPFFGILATAPPKNLGYAHSGPPGSFGGNLDIKHLIAGSKVFLPVHAPYALFMVGDGHAAQGNGEVNVTAIEASLTGRFRLTVQKGRTLNWPRAETPSHWICIGLHERLDEAMTMAIRETISFLMETKNLSARDAYTLASIAVDFEVSQAVNGIKGIHAMIPKSLFKDQ